MKHFSVFKVTFGNSRNKYTASSIKAHCVINSYSQNKFFNFSSKLITNLLYQTKEHIKQIIKLLASIRALDHAVTVANDHNVKELKILIEGK
uniref:Uncharacterized protein n=1 Tax=Strix occidentalis caurina TaxID=311401 RepID=A0A8D0FF50_STROC